MRVKFEAYGINQTKVVALQLAQLAQASVSPTKSYVAKCFLISVTVTYQSVEVIKECQ